MRIDRGIDNLMRLANLSLRDAIRLATTNAAKAGGVPGREQGLVAGDRAGFVQFRLNPTLEVIATYVSGRQVFAS